MCGMSRSQFWWLVVCFVGFFIVGVGAPPSLLPGTSPLFESADDLFVAAAILGLAVWAIGALAIWLGGKLLRWWASR